MLPPISTLNYFDSFNLKPELQPLAKQCASCVFNEGVKIWNNTKICYPCYHLLLKQREIERINFIRSKFKVDQIKSEAISPLKPLKTKVAEQSFFCSKCKLNKFTRKKKHPDDKTVICETCYDFIRRTKIAERLAANGIKCPKCSKTIKGWRNNPNNKLTKVCTSCYFKIFKTNKKEKKAKKLEEAVISPHPLISCSSQELGRSATLDCYNMNYEIASQNLLSTDFTLEFGGSLLEEL
jgi:Zn ribbon nucleic-acid-binding protein